MLPKYIVAIRNVQEQGPDDWKPYRNDSGEINQYDRREKATGVMKAVFYTRWMSGNVKVMTMDDWESLQSKY